jgi:hypothetical protein
MEDAARRGRAGLHARFGEDLFRLVRELGNERHVRQDRDFDPLDHVSLSVVSRRTLQRRDVHRHADHTPERAGPALFAVGVERVELQNFAADRNDRAFALSEKQVAVVANDAQNDHGNDG